MNVNYSAMGQELQCSYGAGNALYLLYHTADRLFDLLVNDVPCVWNHVNGARSAGKALAIDMMTCTW